MYSNFRVDAPYYIFVSSSFKLYVTILGDTGLEIKPYNVNIESNLRQQPLKSVPVLFSPMVSSWVAGKNILSETVSQNF